MDAVVDDVAVVRGLLYNALWEQLYNEQELKESIRMVKEYRVVLERAGIKTPSDVKALGLYNNESREPEEIGLNDINEILFYFLGQKLWNVEWNQNHIRSGSVKYTAVKVIMARGDYDIDEEEVRREVVQKLKDK